MKRLELWMKLCALFYSTERGYLSVRLSLSDVCKKDGGWVGLEQIIQANVEKCIWKSLSYTLTNQYRDNDVDRPSLPDEMRILRLFYDFQDREYTVKHVGSEPLALHFKCTSTDSLSKLIEVNRTESLCEQLEECLRSILEEQVGITNLVLKTKILEPEYKLCDRILRNKGRLSHNMYAHSLSLLYNVAYVLMFVLCMYCIL